VTTERVRKSGNSQAVRMLKEVALREKKKSILRALEILGELPIDSSIKDSRKPQRRKRLLKVRHRMETYPKI
jgi:virulence-associated protein VagC